MKENLHLVLSNSYGHPNIGDQAILRVMIAELREICPSSTISVLTLFPNLTSSTQPGVQSVKSGVFRGAYDTIRTIRHCDLLILGGGGIIQDASSVGNLLFHLSRAYMAFHHRVPVMGYGLGVGPLSNPLSRFLTKQLLQHATILAVRDRASAELLAAIGIDQPGKVRVTADPVMNLKPSTLDPNCRLVSEITARRSEGKLILGISLRTSMLRDPLLSPTRLVENLATALIEVKQRVNFHIVFFSMHPAQDDKLYKPLCQALGRGNTISFAEGKTDPQVMLSLVGLSDLFIGMRLHSLIFAARFGIPMIGLSYSPKVAGFMQLIQQDERVLQPGDWEVNEIEAQLRYIIQNRDSLAQSIRQRVEELQVSASENFRLVMKVISHNC